MIVGRKRREADRREALALLGDGIGHQLIERVTLRVHVATHAVARLATHQLIDWHAVALGLDVPERDVDRRNGAADQRAHEVRVPLQRLRVMLNRRRVASLEIGLHLVDHGGGRPWPAVHACLAGTDRAVLAMDAQQAPALDQERLELFDPGRGQVAEARGHGPTIAGPAPLARRQNLIPPLTSLFRSFSNTWTVDSPPPIRSPAGI